MPRTRGARGEDPDRAAQIPDLPHEADPQVHNEADPQDHIEILDSPKAKARASTDRDPGPKTRRSQKSSRPDPSGDIISEPEA